ncbi:MAG: hypothetical protein CAK90_00295 [Spartobacteria bacterium AMD-G4]|nr:MAG: hypothetical protein CAK90_00295 [Spartobacteria bacterium AMD-G4]
MQEPDFEFVDNARTGLAKYSLERLKTIAPTFRERSAERLACVELIAEKERELAIVQMGAISRKASLALTLSLVAVVWPILLLAAWFYFQPILRKLAPTRASPPQIVRPMPTPTPEPIEIESTPEPLPPMLGEPLPTPVGG